MTQSTEQERAEIEALARRKAWRYKKSSDPHHSDTYTFNTHTLHDFADALLQAARRAQVVAQLTEAQIREILLAHGFTIKDGLTDLKPYVYEAARALLAAEPQPPEAETPAVQVPRFNHAAKRKLEMLTGDGATVTGYAFQKKDGRRGSIDCGGFVAWWPEADIGNPISNGNQQVAEAAPVQMPEPVAYVHVPSLAWGGKVRPVVGFEKYEDDHKDGVYSLRTPLYTEHQVRQLLAHK